MKKYLICSLIFLVAATSVTAQTTRMNVRKPQLDTMHYAEEAFKSGMIYFTDNTRTPGALNIELIRQTIYFIDENGSEMELADNGNVRLVVIGKNTYYRSGSDYIRIMATTKDNTGLGKVTNIKILEEAKKGAFGTTSETTSITMVGRISSSGRVYDFEDGQEIDIIYKEIPYLFKDGNFMTASKKSFNKIFPGSKAQIEEYLSNNKVKFDSYKDVEEMFNALLKSQQ